MEFGLFGGARRTNDGPTGDSQGYEQFIDYVLEAEQLGFSSVFLVEHHFTGLGQISASLELLTYIAARTSSMRLGTAVTVLPWHNPVLLAEQVATLDVLSGGRLDLGIGRGYRPNEFHGFALDVAEAQERYEECLQVLVQGLTSEERFSHEGKHWQFRDIVVEPRPIQQPHPPIWVGAGSEASIRKAAANGFRLLLDQYGDVETTRRCIDWYRDELRTSGRSYDPTDVALTRALMVVDDDDDATLEHQYELRMGAIRLLREASQIPGQELQIDDHAFYNDTRAATEAAAIAGTPDRCIERIQLLREAGVETILFNDPLGSVERLRLFTKEVLPAVS